MTTQYTLHIHHKKKMKILQTVLEMKNPRKSCKNSNSAAQKVEREWSGKHLNEAYPNNLVNH